MALWCLLSFAGIPRRPSCPLVLGGRDADTIAAILGNLLGVLHGDGGFPERWTGSNLEDAERLVELEDGLYDLRWTSC